MNKSVSQSHSKAYIILLTLVATLGGLLFGYDTAVINGAVGAIESNFIDPLPKNPELAAKVIMEYKILASLCFLVIGALLTSFFVKLFGKRKGSGYSLILWVLLLAVIYQRFLILGDDISQNIANSINGFAVSSALIGCIIGASVAGYISQNIGRKTGLMLAAGLFILSALGSALPDKLNFTTMEVLSSFILYRIIGGVGVGLASMIAPMYIAEISPAERRGNLVSWYQFAVIFGMLVVYFVNYFIAKGNPVSWVNTEGWRWMFASEIIPASIFIGLLFTVPETPRYHVLKGKNGEAERVLQKLMGAERAGSTLESIKESLKERRLPWLSFGGKLIVIGVLLSVFQQFVGINVVLYYASKIFRSMGATTEASLLQTVIVGAVNLTFTVIAIFTVDKLGRKPLQITGALGMAVSMITLGFLFYSKSMGLGALVAMLVYTAAFAISWGPVVWVLLSEIFPNSIRGAMSIAVAAQWIANLTVSWTFPMLNDNVMLTEMFNNGFAYWIYGLMSLLAAFFMWRFVPETKGRQLEDMGELWNRESKQDSSY